GIDVSLPRPVSADQLYVRLAALLAPGDRDAPGSMITRGMAAEASPAARGRILVVDDNPVNQLVALRMLEKMGHVVDVADNGVVALERVAGNHYDAVLMDCQMPAMDGFEATREIRFREGGDWHTPIIAMTAGAMRGDEEKCLEAGMDAYLSKPITADSLARVMGRWTMLGARSHPGPQVLQVEDGLLDTTLISGLRDLGAEEFRNLIQLFLSDGAERVAALRSAEADGDGPAIGNIAHSLRGSAATFGARALAQLCAELQEQASSGELAERTTLIDSVD
ncbi:multi-sensor hybrid histidine kinase, partial [mine drainage metagenome]